MDKFTKRFLNYLSNDKIEIETKRQIILFLLLLTCSVTALIFFLSSSDISTRQKDKSNSIGIKIDSIMEIYYSKNQFNGSILISKDNNILFSKGYGFADLRKKKKNSPSTKFNIASLTKQFTAMAVLMVEEEGLLSTSDLISDYIDYPIGKEHGITIEHLLTHTSGIPNYTELPNSNTLHQKELRPIELFYTFKNLNLEFDPGTDFKYSNSGYALLGLLIETVKDQELHEVLDDKIFIPLEMNSTQLSKTYYSNDKALGYNIINTKFTQPNDIKMSIPYAAGAIESTVEDLKKWHDALSKYQLLTEESYKKMYKPRLNGYSYGWNSISIPSFNDPKNQLSIVDHGGALPGYSSHITRILTDNILIVSLNNCNCAPLMNIHAEIAKLLYKNL